jgi:hypothetical protein
MIVELDLLSKSIGLFPQSSKIDIREIAKQLYMILRDEALYSSFSAELLHAILGKIPEQILLIFNRYVKKIFAQEDRIGISDLKAACGAWLLQNRALNYAETKQLVIHGQNWWLKTATLPYVDDSFIGLPSYGHLLNQSIRTKQIDNSLLAAYLIAVNDIRLTASKVQLNEAASLLLKEFGVVARAKSSTCGIEAAINTMFKIPIIGINWRNIFTTRYAQAEKRIIRTKSYFKTDPSAWVNIIDTFDDLLLDALFDHDGTIGTYQLGNIGGVLNSSASSFAAKYPKIFKAVKDIHEKRLESDLSHIRVRRTGKVTRPIKFSYIPKACKLLYEAFTELRDKW